jgi:chromosome segregation ATPase
MNFKSAIIFASAVILVLVVALAGMKHQTEGMHIRNTASLLELSNRLDTTGVTLNNLQQINLMLTNDLATLSQRFEMTSNDFSDASGQLTRTKSELDNEQNQVTDLNNQVGDLQPQSQELGERATSLSNNYVLRNDQLAVLRQQLGASESNNVFLTAKLQEVMAQKSEWQRRFNDLDEVRAQFNYLAYGFY